MRPVSFLLTLSVLAVPSGRAEPLQIHGTTGYAGEYELSGSVSEQDLNGKNGILRSIDREAHWPLYARWSEGDRWRNSVRTRQVVVPHHCDAGLRWKQVYLQGFFSESYHGFMD
jgi:hypothetical protein